MKMCMEPCKGACTHEEYAAETERVRSFLETNGDSMLAELAAKREAASEAMDFEAAAAVHKQWEKVKAATQLADELVQPLVRLRALIVQAAAPTSEESPRETANVFAFDQGRITGPERLSTLGVRAVREQTAVGSSLFAQPLMLAAVPLEDAGQQVVETAAVLSPEERARAVIARLDERVRDAGTPEIEERCDYLSLLRRWYYRPENKRAGAILFPNPDGGWPVRRLLNAAAREALGPPREAAAVNREAAKATKTRMLHEGREGVERLVPVLPRRSRSKKAAPADGLPDQPASDQK
jgi:hypothetical protein